MARIDIKRRLWGAAYIITAIPWLVLALVLQIMIWIGEAGGKIDKSNTLSRLLDKTTLKPRY